jgi:hypothetical protein
VLGISDQMRARRLTSHFVRWCNPVVGGILAVLGADWAIDDIVTTVSVVVMGLVLLLASRRRPVPDRAVERVRTTRR